MGDEKHKNRYYQKDSYEAPMQIFGTGIAFIVVGSLALLFNMLSIDIIGLRYWGYWLFIPAFFIMIGGFSQISINNRYKKAVKGAILNRGSQGTHKLEHIALEVGIKPKDLLRVLQDLREKGEIQYRFNPDTGLIELGQMIQYNPVSNYVSPGKVEAPIPAGDKKYCVYCGHQFDKDAQFCPSCGSSILK